ncbi:MAG TPA: hypothetical protein VK665_01115, partial [Candidatus Elarobacter sp.]|nr:hypothetical protein [Candidatus Elarobacter sp.]
STPPVPQGKPSVSPANAQVTAIASPVTVTLSEPGYGGTFTVNASACTGIASVTQSSSSGAPNTSYTISGIAPGQCAVSFTDSFAQSVALPVSVTVSQVIAR